MPDALVAMNPAALKTNIDDLPEGGMLVVSVDSFKKMNLSKAGMNPIHWRMKTFARNIIWSNSI